MLPQTQKDTRKKYIIADADEEYREVLRVALEDFLDAIVFEAVDQKQLLLLLDKHQDIEHVFLDPQLYSDQIQNKTKKITQLFGITKIELFNRIPKWTPSEAKTNKKRVPVFVLPINQELEEELWIQLGVNHEVVRYKKNDILSENDKADLLNKKVHFLYTSALYANNLIQEYLKNEKYSIEKYFLSTSPFFSIPVQYVPLLQEWIQAPGFTTEDKKKISQVFDQVIEEAKKMEFFDILMDRLSRDEYFGGHSKLLAFFSVFFALRSMKRKTTESFLQSLVYASFLHDFTLEDHRLAEMDHPSELALEQSSAEEILDFEQHPFKAKGLVLACDHIPPICGEIVLDHHEKPDGSGFPFQKDEDELSQESLIFEVSHELIRCLMHKTVDEQKRIHESPEEFKKLLPKSFQTKKVNLLMESFVESFLGH